VVRPRRSGPHLEKSLGSLPIDGARVAGARRSSGRRMRDRGSSSPSVTWRPVCSAARRGRPGAELRDLGSTYTDYVTTGIRATRGTRRPARLLRPGSVLNVIIRGIVDDSIAQRLIGLGARWASAHTSDLLPFSAPLQQCRATRSCRPTWFRRQGYGSYRPGTALDAPAIVAKLRPHQARRSMPGLRPGLSARPPA